MRLNSAQVEAIKMETEHFYGAKAGVWMFGLRLDDTEKDGYLDLYVRAMPVYPKSGAVKQRGFTLVELITVIVIVGILSAIAVPRLFNRDLFDSRGFYDQVISGLRYAQKTAVSQRRLVCVTFPAPNRMVLRTAAAFGAVACNTDLLNPTGTYPPLQTTYTIENLNGVTLGGTVAFNFDALGRPSFAGALPLTITVSGYAASNVCIAPQTGYVYGQGPAC